MRDHSIKSMGGHLLKTEILLDALLEKFAGPAQPVPHDKLTCRGPQIIAGKIRAATIRSIAPFGTPRLDLAHVAQRARGVSDANVHSLPFVPMRHQTHGVPLAPAMTTEKRGKVAPLLRGGGGQRERFRCDAARCPQGNNEVPAFIGNRLLDLFVVIVLQRDFPTRSLFTMSCRSQKSASHDCLQLFSRAAARKETHRQKPKSRCSN